MELTLSEGCNKNYVGSVVKLLTIRPIPKADFIKATSIFGNSVVVSHTAQIGDVGIYFPLESQLMPEFLSKYNQYKHSLGLNENLSIKTGFFEEKGRVKAIRLRGEKSEGFFLPIEGLTEDFVGTDFDTIDGTLIVKKYVVKETKMPGTPGKKGDKKLVKKFDRIPDNQFRLHVDTAQLRKNIFQLDPDDIIGVHYKKHGTSWVVSNCLVRRPLKWYEKILVRLGVDINDTEYDYIYSSRKVVKNQYLQKPGQNTYYDYDLWKDIADRVKGTIPKNFTLYGEAIGYLPTKSFIQNPFDYGCKEGEFKIYVYRITITNPDGKVVELDDKQIEEFCERNGLLYKDTFMFYGTVKDHYFRLFLEPGKYREEQYRNFARQMHDENPEWRDNYLMMLLEKYNEKDCYMCANPVPEEGIIIRKQSLYEFIAYKLKSFRFLQKETDDLDLGIENIESQS